jgi:hypothetical protein
MKIVIVLVLIALAAYFVIGGIVAARNRRRDKDAPANMDPAMRAVRRRRAEEGKRDNWLTRPHVRFDGSGRGPLVKFFPKDD